MNHLLNKLKSDRRAISPILATIVLIAITVAGGLLVYNVFFATAGTLSARTQVEIESVNMVKTTSGATVFSITLQNTGNKFLNSVAYTVTGDTGTLTATLNNLQPGQSQSDTKTNPAGFSVTPGKTYPVSITATASDGSTAQYTSSVLASSG